MKMYKVLGFIGIILSVMLMTQSGCGSTQKSADNQMVDSVAVDTVPQEAPPAEPKPKAETPAGKVPAITIEKSVHDFGEVGPSTRHTCEFKFKNTGTAVLVIDRVQSTCGCTVPALDKNEYAPGEEGVVNVTFTAPNTKSKTTKHIYIVSNAPKTPRAELTIQAEVVVKVEVSPENVELRFDEPNAGMPNLVVKSIDDKPFSIQSITISPQNVMSIPFNQSQKAAEFVLAPKVDMTKLNQTPNGVIQINTDHPQSGTLVVRFRAIPEYEITPARIILQNVEPGVPVVRDVLIRSNYDKDVEFASAESRNGYMEVDSQDKDGKHLRMQVKITPPEQDVTSRRYITDELKVTLKDGTVLSIRCSGWYKLQ